MRIPKINSKNTEVIKEQTLSIYGYSKIKPNNMEFLDDDKSKISYVKKVERMVRSSYEYKELISFLKEEIDMNSCTFLPNLTREDISIEIHHAPFTLFDITSILLNHFQNSYTEFSPFDLAEKVIECHYNLEVGLIPLSKTVHELVHNGKIFIPIDNVFGNIEEFVDKYSDGINENLWNIYNENINASKQLNKENYSPSILERKFTYLNIEGVDFPKLIEQEEIESA